VNKNLISKLTIIIITLIVYSNSFTGEFISGYDDELNVVQNNDIKELSAGKVEEKSKTKKTAVKIAKKETKKKVNKK